MRSPEERLPVPSVAAFEKLVVAGFSHRRKRLYNSLEDTFEAEAVKSGLTSIGLSQGVRPEELLLEEWTKLSWRLCPKQGDL